LKFFIYAGFLLSAGAAAAQNERPFSHRIHLKLKPDCAGCHASVVKSKRVEDNNLPDKAVCLPCHKNAIVTKHAAKKPAATLLAHFDHEKHLKLGNIAPVIAAAIDSKQYFSPAGSIRRHLNTANACAACHRGLEESDAVTHSALPQMADCLVCHNKIDPPFSCEFCHSKNANLKPASLTRERMRSRIKRAARSAMAAGSPV